MGRDCIFGVIRDSMRGNGETIRCMAREFRYGQIIVSILGSMPMARRRVMENIYGKLMRFYYCIGMTARSSRGLGKGDISMDLES